MNPRKLITDRGLAPTGPNGTYRRRDYLRGAGVSTGISLVLVGALVLLKLTVGESQSVVVPAATFVLGIGLLVSVGAAIALSICSLLNTSRPPLFADPLPPPRPDEAEE